MFTRRLRSKAAAVVLMSLTLAATQACTGTPGSPGPQATALAPSTAPSVAAPQVTPMTDISAGCAGNSSEVEEAFAPPSYIYAEWIGCGGIGFARSTDSGQHFDAAMTVPGSKGPSWDPAITVAADGTIYAAFMHASPQAPGPATFPVVAVSHDHGASFTQVHEDRPPAAGNWGDRDFIAAGRGDRLFLTWDYGPSSAEVKALCANGGSCAFSSGDLNAVIQTSGDGGATWGPVIHLQPGFPLGGGYSAPLVVRPDGRVDVLYSAHPTDPGTGQLHPGYEYFTSSADGTRWPAAPRSLWPGQGTLSLPEWWIDGDISTDTAGNLYATWDTQTAAVPGPYRGASRRTPTTPRTSSSQPAGGRESRTSPGRPARPRRVTPRTCARSPFSTGGSAPRSRCPPHTATSGPGPATPSASPRCPTAASV